MREIKFRAWIKKGVYANAMVCQDGPDLDGVIYYTATVDGQDIYYNFEDIMDDEFFSLMQYTGLKDKNGKEIYEGDIVHDGSVSWKVEFKDGCFLGIIEHGRYLHTIDNLEIIGNIYENPELVKE